MKHIKTFIFILLASAASTVPSIVSGQTNTTLLPSLREGPGMGYIEVTGTAEQEVAPDEIFISFFITEKFAVAGLPAEVSTKAGASSQEKITIEKQEKKLKKGLKNLGVDLKNFTPAPAGRGAMPTVDIPVKNYVLKVSSTAITEKVFSLLEKNEIRSAYVSRIGHSGIEELKKETRIMAIKAAKEKAGYLLSAIGEQAGKAIFVQEKESGKPLTGEMNNIGGLPSPGGFYMQGNIGIIELKKIKIQAEVIVKFEIK